MAAIGFDDANNSYQNEEMHQNYLHYQQVKTKLEI